MPVVKLSGITKILAQESVLTALGALSPKSKMHLMLFKGAVPTRQELNGFTELNTFRNNDLVFSTLLDDQSATEYGFSVGNRINNSAHEDQKPTWFILCGVTTVVQNQVTKQMTEGIICGDVGLSGSGAALTLQVETLNKKTKYKIESLGIKLPVNFLY